MIHRLARLLAAEFPERDGEDLADALWLAATCVIPTPQAVARDGDPSVPIDGSMASPVAPGDGSAFAKVGAREPATKGEQSNAFADLALPTADADSTAQKAGGVTAVGFRIAATSPFLTTAATALSLFRRVCRPGRPIVDVDATVEATADAQRLVVVSRPEPARGLDVAIVVDQSPVALVWADAINELEGTLRRTGAFRAVSRWSLDRPARTSSIPEPLIRDATGAVHRAGHIIDPAGRRLVLLLSDGTADYWRHAHIWQVLRRWAQAMPIALVHLLPEPYWGYTTIGQPTAVIRSPRPATPNVSVEIRTAWWSDEVDLAGVPLPVVEFTPEAITRWARAVVTGSTWTEAIWTHPPQAAGNVAVGNQPTAADRVRAFQARASGGAQQLARILAGAPLVSLPLMRVIHDQLIPQPSTGQLAELLVSGLLEPDNPSHRNLLLRFRPGVADLLYKGTTTSQEWDVFDLLTRYLERNAAPGDAVRALLTHPSGTTSIDGNLIPFAAMGREMALRLGLDVGEPSHSTASTRHRVVGDDIQREPDWMSTGRPVLIRYTRDGVRLRGSGLRVGGRFVLTADHCANGTGHYLVVGGHEYPATVHVRSHEEAIDVAVLIADNLPELETLRCVLVNRGVDQDLNECRALGFPSWKLNPLANKDSETPLLARARGTVSTAEGIDPYGKTVGLFPFKITDPEAKGRTIPVGDLEKSVWAGMSGSAVVTPDDLLIGVIRSHTLAEGGRSLTITPLDAISTLPPQTAGQFWAALGVNDPGALPRLPPPPETTPTLDVSVGQVVVGTIPQQPLGFVARDTVDRLARTLETGRAAVVCAVTGLHGVGKTQVAAAYARQRITDGWGVVGWVNADSSDRLLTDLAAIAKELGVHDPDGDSNKSARRLTQQLTTRTIPGLIVFDNATDLDLIRGYLPAAGATQIVITSTDLAFTELGASVAVDTYTRSESRAYLRDRTGLDDDSGADRVARSLGDHPLALAQAAGTIRRRHWTYQSFLDRLAAAPIDRLLNRLPGQDYPLATAAALLLSIRHLEADDPTGHTNQVLRLLAVLSPDGVPHDVLQPLTDILDVDLDELLERCAAGSAVTWSVTGDAVLMHRLMARVLRERDALTGDLLGSIRLAAVLLGHQLIPEALAWEKRSAAALLIDQIDAVWAALGSNVPTADANLLTDLLQQRSWAVRQLTAVADLNRAIELANRVMIDDERILGPDHPHTLESRNNLAYAYESAGKLDEAIPLYEQTLADSERILGPYHPDTLDLRNNLAYAYESAGKLGAAIPLYEQTLADSERLLGPDHPDTLTSRNNLAIAYESAGRLAEALRLKMQTLADRQRVLGRDHPDTLTSRNNLAFAYKTAGRFDEAISLFEQTLADRQRVLGPDNPEALDSRNNLASALRSAGRFDEAISLYEQTLADRQRILGPDNPNTLISRNNLAYAYRSANRLQQALPLSEQVLADSELTLGPDHPITMTSRNNLALTYQSAGKLDKAISLNERNLADRERVLGPDHPDTLTSRNNLAGAYESAGRLTEAIPLHEKTLADRQRVLGPDHPDTLTSRNNLAAAHSDLVKAHAAQADDP